MPEADTFPDLDQYLNAEVLLPNGEHMQAATVMLRSKDANGRVQGRASDTPILDTRVYDVLFPDGVIKQYAANVLAEAKAIDTNYWTPSYHIGRMRTLQ